MTLEELKDAIDDMVAEHGEEILQTKVMAAYDYGDYHHTQALTDFDELDLIVPKDSAYSCSGKALPSEEEREEIEDVKCEIVRCQMRINNMNDLDADAEWIAKAKEELVELRVTLDELEEAQGDAEHVIALM